MSVRLLIGDCRDRLREMPDQSVQSVVTSPPYFGLRDYGVEGQMGSEPTPERYVLEMIEVFRNIRRVLRDDGTVWLNLGDSYSRSPSKGGSGPNGKNETRWGYGAAQSAKTGSSDGAVGRGDRPGTRSGGLGEKQLLGIPWRVAFALQDDGWYLRQDIIWHKPNPMPESVRDRCTRAHEYLFMLTKSARYYYDAEAIKEPGVYAGPPKPGKQAQTAKTGLPVHSGSLGHPAPRRDKQRGHSRRHAGFNARWDSMTKAEQQALGRNKRSVWEVATRPYSGAHFATFPPALIEPCIRAGTSAGDTVLDPFAGSGTTGYVADYLQRDAVLIEMNPEYADLIRERMECGGRLFSNLEAVP